MKQKSETKPEKVAPFTAQVSYAGRSTECRVYTDQAGGLYVRLPNGKRAPVTKRRDDTYVATE
jgi:hypothetical protein